jgi:hypothetical protein
VVLLKAVSTAAFTKNLRKLNHSQMLPRISTIRLLMPPRAVATTIRTVGSLIASGDRAFQGVELAVLPLDT